MRISKEEYNLLPEVEKLEYGLRIQLWYSGKFCDLADEKFVSLEDLQNKYPNCYFLETYQTGFNSKVFKRNIALDVCKLNWEYIQVSRDGSTYKSSLDKVVEELMELPQKDAIKLLLQVIEAQQLTTKYPEPESPFKDMLEFKYLE